MNSARTDVPLAGGGRQTHDVVLRSGDVLRGAVEQQGQVRAAQGAKKPGIESVRRALAIQQRRLGSSHPDTRETAAALQALDR